MDRLFYFKVEVIKYHPFYRIGKICMGKMAGYKVLIRGGMNSYEEFFSEKLDVYCNLTLNEPYQFVGTQGSAFIRNNSIYTAMMTNCADSGQLQQTIAEHGFRN
ncbi:unnamed protein product [Caenorhabditis bovis]|uniref:Uncharacterized protein n=1 Tax=Caenorhabditis bovis TaxID=2654633 RepID=A0A8S1EYI3_9PELO|nr:unnamed protein product [Caenorhabditis bovis]